MKDLFRKLLKKMGDEFFTIPNILSFVRILLIPVIVYFYCFKQNNLWTVIIVAFSSLTDIVDGFIARKFNMITDFGKFLDPFADKATQIAVLSCLITRFHAMAIPCVVLVVKELTSLAARLFVYSKTELIRGAKWHGKLATCFVIFTVVTHLVWYDMNDTVSLVITGACTLMLLISFVLYSVESVQMLKSNGKQEN